MMQTIKVTYYDYISITKAKNLVIVNRCEIGGFIPIFITLTFNSP